MTSCLAVLVLAAVYAKLDYLPDDPLPPPAREPAKVRVCLDPGHGGSADGARSGSGKVLEKDLNLLFARDIRQALTNAGFQVVMTRDDDRDVELSVRPAVAVMNDCDVFISVHHNAPGPDQDPKTTRYASVYSWNPLGASLSESVAAHWHARALHANFMVTRNPHIPSILLEADFITHPRGEAESLDPAVRRRRATGVVAGLLDWLGACKR